MARSMEHSVRIKLTTNGMIRLDAIYSTKLSLAEGQKYRSTQWESYPQTTSQACYPLYYDYNVELLWLIIDL